MILVDTSVWIEFLRSGSEFNLDDIVARDEIVTCPPVIQEVLQGIQGQRRYRIAHGALRALPVAEAPMNLEVFVEAAELFRSARRVGLTVRSGTDCLIAVCALRNGLTVLHRDRDFDALARVAPLEVMRVNA